MINIQLSSKLSQREPRWHFMLFTKALTISLAGLIISLIAYFPGAMSPDSFDMWGMGWKLNWNDWHSPYIALLMTFSRLLRDDPAIYLFFSYFFFGAEYTYALQQ